MSRAIRFSAVAILWVMPSMPAAAQTSEPRHSVTLKGGTNVERAEDNLAGSSGAVGAAVGKAFSSKWRGEIELWFPKFIESGSPDSRKRHRDVVANVAAIRSFGAGRVQPFVLFGLGVGVTQDRFPLCTALRPSFGTGDLVPSVVSCSETDILSRHEERFDGVSLFGLAGAGGDIRATSRISLVPEVRLNLLGTAVITRPSLGVKVAF